MTIYANLTLLNNVRYLMKKLVSSSVNQSVSNSVIGHIIIPINESIGDPIRFENYSILNKFI